MGHAASARFGPVFWCLGDYLADPRAYDPQDSMRRHVTALLVEIEVVAAR